MSDKNLSFIAFYDEKGIYREGYFEVILNNGVIIKFKTNSGNIITIPVSRLLKLKEKEKNEK